MYKGGLYNHKLLCVAKGKLLFDKMSKSNFVARIPLKKINILINISVSVVQHSNDHSFLFRIFVCLFNSDKAFAVISNLSGNDTMLSFASAALLLVLSQ